MNKIQKFGIGMMILGATLPFVVEGVEYISSKLFESHDRKVAEEALNRQALKTAKGVVLNRILMGEYKAPVDIAYAEAEEDLEFFRMSARFYE